MTHLRHRMIEDMQLKGFSRHTQRAYLTSVRNLARYCRRPPDQVSEEEIRQFFLHLINERNLAGGTVSAHLTGIKFLYEKTLKREWPILDFVRPKKETKLPVVLEYQGGSLPAFKGNKAHTAHGAHHDLFLWPAPFRRHTSHSGRHRQ